MDKGFSRVEAYTAATYKMVHQLLKAEFLYVPRSGGQEVYKHDNVDVWLKVISANRKGTDAVSVETTSDFARFYIGIDEAIDGTFYKVSE